MPYRARKTVRKGPAGLDPSAGAKNSKIKPPYSKRNRGGCFEFLTSQARESNNIFVYFYDL